MDEKRGREQKIKIMEQDCQIHNGKYSGAKKRMRLNRYSRDTFSLGPFLLKKILKG
jgi:hypothetical protein